MRVDASPTCFDIWEGNEVLTGQQVARMSSRGGSLDTSAHPESSELLLTL